MNTFRVPSRIPWRTLGFGCMLFVAADLRAADLAEGFFSSDSLENAQVRFRTRMRERAFVGRTPSTSDSLQADSFAAEDPAQETPRLVSDSVPDHDSDVYAGYPANYSADFSGQYSAYDANPSDSAIPAFFAEFRFPIALFDDFQVGGRFGAELTRLGPVGLDFLLDAEGRPFRKAVRVPESATLEYQFQEHRISFGPGLGLRLRLPGEGSPELTGAAGGAFSFGWYRGTAREAPAVFRGWLEAGIRFGSPGSYFGMYYQYFPLPQASAHRVVLSWGWGADKGGPR